MKLTYKEKESIEKYLSSDLEGDHVSYEECLGAEQLGCLVDDLKVMVLRQHEVNEPFNKEELELEFLRVRAKECVIGIDNDKYVVYDENADDYQPYTPAFWNMFLQKNPLFYALGFTVDQVKEKLEVLDVAFFDIDIVDEEGNDIERNRYAAWIDYDAEEDY